MLAVVLSAESPCSHCHLCERLLSFSVFAVCSSAVDGQGRRERIRRSSSRGKVDTCMTSRVVVVAGDDEEVSGFMMCDAAYGWAVISGRTNPKALHEVLR